MDSLEAGGETRRRNVLDAVKRKEICAILAVGCSRLVAARYVGCHPATIRRTALRDEVFAVALEQAETRHEILHLSHINKAAEEGRYWRAAAWALERKYPSRYAQRPAGAITLDQVAQALGQFAEVICEEIPEPADRDRILERLGQLTEGLRGVDAGEEEGT